MKVGPMVFLNLYALKVTLSGAWDNYKVCTIPDQFKPPKETQLRQKVIVANSDQDYSCAAWINVKGDLYVGNFGGTGLNGTHEVSCVMCWCTK